MSNTTMNQAKRILETHTSGELAAKLGIKSTNFSGLKSGKRPLTEKMAARIVEAYGGKVAKQEKPVKAKGPAKVAEPAEKTGWHAPNKPPSLTRDQQQAKQDMAKLVEEANALLCRMGMAGVARAALAKVIEDEVGPALKELIEQALSPGSTGGSEEHSASKLPAFLVVPLYEPLVVETSGGGRSG